MKKQQWQKSEAFSTIFFLTMSGGLQDAYTYYSRGKVFANAQTGNIILSGHKLAQGEWYQMLRYVVPVISFLFGIYAAEKIKWLYRRSGKIHWRQIVVLIEILLLFAVGFIPENWNLAANIIVSFVCAMQVEAFRKVKGTPFASTMCIGNLRNGMELFCNYLHKKDRKALGKSFRYFGIVLCFGAGAVLGSVAVNLFGLKTIWISCVLLLICFCIMVEREEKVWDRKVIR